MQTSKNKPPITSATAVTHAETAVTDAIPDASRGTAAGTGQADALDEARLRNLNADALAYMGDAVYEKMVREMLLRQGISRPDRLHRMATEYVSAAAQAQIMQEVWEELTPQEQTMVKRWRNHKYHSKAKHADPMTYKWATAFEAWIGYLYLSGDEQRLDWLFARAAEVIAKNSRL